MKIKSGTNINALCFLKAIFFCLVFTAVFIALSFTKPFFPGNAERLIHGIIGMFAAIFTTYLFLRFDRRTFSGIGLIWEPATLKRFITGVIIGIVIMGLMTMGVIYFSGFKIGSNNNSNLFNFLLLTLPLVPMAFMEELAFRGYPLIVLKEKMGPRLSIFITSFLFGLYHIANGWTIENALLGAGVWGLVFGLAAVYSQGISMSTGLHYAANLTTAAFGTTTDSFNIWVLKQENGASLENYRAGQLTKLIPMLGLLVFAIICMEWFLRKKSKLPGDPDIQVQ